MKIASRVNQVPPYLFVQISRKIAEKKAQGVDVISFGIGDPDLATPREILDGLFDASEIQGNHRYPETEGLPEFRVAVAEWYKDRFGIQFDPEKEVLSLIGAKEGIGHAALSFVEPGDIALVPDPGYPVYSVGTLFAGGESYFLPLNSENNWLPDFSKIPDEISKKATVLWINYPNNPTGAIADLEFFEDVVKFAKKNDIAVMHDNCYSEVTFDGYKPPSFFEVDGSKDIGLEFHSLSKTYNMTGWRIGMVVGNPDLIQALMIVKSNLDSGVSQAIQNMGIAALKLPEQYISDRNKIYQKRRDSIIEVLTSIGLEVEKTKASLYIWAKIPEGFTSGELCEIVLDQTGIVFTPGLGYGANGEGYVRLSITIDDSDLQSALDRLNDWTPPWNI